MTEVLRTFSPEEAAQYQQEQPEAELMFVTEALSQVLSKESNK